MARLTALPSTDIIRGFKGVLDFYLWKGLPCVRRWATTPKSRQTQATKDAAALFGQVSTNYRLLAALVLLAYQIAAKNQPRTARDLYISGVYGHLHEASMSDFLTLLTECRDFLSALTALLNALHSVDTDELVVNVDESVLPAGASTLAEQQTQTTALQKVADLQDALESKALDRFLVRGMDQLHSYRGTLVSYRGAVISGANGFLDSTLCPAGQVWVVTSVSAKDNTSPTTAHRFHVRLLGLNYEFHENIAAIAAGERTYWTGFKWISPGNAIRIVFPGALVGDTCSVVLTGHSTTLEP